MVLHLSTQTPIIPQNAGLSVARGLGIHPDRVIDSYELIFVRSGELSMEEDGRALEIGPRQSLILQPWKRHRGTKVYPKNLSFYWVHFQIAERHRARRGKALEIPQVASVRRHDRLGELFHRFLDDQESGELQPFTASLLIMLMLGEVASSRGQAYAAPGTSAALATRAQTLIQSRFNLPLNTSGIAAELSCNADYLGRTFQRHFGKTIIDAIHEQRLRTARKLLLESSLNVNQIAKQCGFSSSIYFCRVFKRAQGTPPLAYRRRHARMHVVTDE
jgi:AraC-like DNA-binding protein